MERAVAGDVPEILRVRRAAEDWLAGMGIEQWPRAGVPADVVSVQVGQGEWLVARNDDAVCGAFRLLWSGEPVWPGDGVDAGYVNGLVIDRSHAGGGLGSRLLAWAGDLAREAGATALRLYCVEHNHRLRRYYVDQGFRPAGRGRFASGGTAVLFEKQLSG
ncbi:acetyltransferase (GNAT) family protein [Actinocrispum wychmicini]|uniref:Acetyltransferase (GNAT) family protein n=2 Tax=Actinocrispum wychmicini TaxID=1213861 RepID=A0A4R2JVP9_9PSEU|nr:acetyltransferase (GNAT) family protein [Actinocrispum wychmicini]